MKGRKMSQERMLSQRLHQLGTWTGIMESPCIEMGRLWKEQVWEGYWEFVFGQAKFEMPARLPSNFKEALG